MSDFARFADVQSRSQHVGKGRESRMGAVAWAIGQRSVSHPTGSPRAVTRPRLPQNVACGFPAPRSSDTASQHSVALDPGIREHELWSLERIPLLQLLENVPTDHPLPTATTEHLTPVTLYVGI